MFPIWQKELNEQYEKILLDLLSLPYPNSDMPIIRLDGDALDVYRQFSEKIEARLLTDLEDMSDWGGKCAGTGTTRGTTRDNESKLCESARILV